MYVTGDTLLGEKRPTSFAALGGRFSTSTASVPIHVQVSAPASALAGSETWTTHLLRSWMQGAVASVFGKLMRPDHTPAEAEGRMPNAKSSDVTVRSRVPSIRRWTGYVTPFTIRAYSVEEAGDERICGGARSGTTVPPTTSSPEPSPDTVTASTAVPTSGCG